VCVVGQLVANTTLVTIVIIIIARQECSVVSTAATWTDEILTRTFGSGRREFGPAIGFLQAWMVLPDCKQRCDGCKEKEENVRFGHRLGDFEQCEAGKLLGDKNCDHDNLGDKGGSRKAKGGSREAGEQSSTETREANSECSHLTKLPTIIVHKYSLVQVRAFPAWYTLRTQRSKDPKSEIL
jgi:hypothetical protein